MKTKTIIFYIFIFLVFAFSDENLIFGEQKFDEQKKELNEITTETNQQIKREDFDPYSQKISPFQKTIEPIIDENLISQKEEIEKTAQEIKKDIEKDIESQFQLQPKLEPQPQQPQPQFESQSPKLQPQSLQPIKKSKEVDKDLEPLLHFLSPLPQKISGERKITIEIKNIEGIEFYFRETNSPTLIYLGQGIKTKEDIWVFNLKTKEIPNKTYLLVLKIKGPKYIYEREVSIEIENEIEKDEVQKKELQKELEKSHKEIEEKDKEIKLQTEETKIKIIKDLKKITEEIKEHVPKLEEEKFKKEITKIEPQIINIIEDVKENIKIETKSEEELKEKKK